MKTVNFITKNEQFAIILKETMLAKSFNCTILQQENTNIFMVKIEVQTIDEAFTVGITTGHLVYEEENKNN